MPTYRIRGVDVDFPYEAYDSQLVYMEKVIQSLQDKRNALLESPTGTGKTLCLLCATLAWRKSFGEFSRGLKEGLSFRGTPYEDDELTQSQSSKLPTIFYTSRTHSQIKQVIQELKRSNYRPKMMVLGSREQLCIHEHVSVLRGKTQTSACQALCKKRTKQYCAHFSLVTDFVKKNPNIGDDPIDIEDLVNLGRSCGPCPYYLSREFHKEADILFAPYNYLIDRANRRTLKNHWNGSIIIFDEAHNLESLCADAASFDLPSSLLSACISEVKKCVDLAVTRRGKSRDESCNPDSFAILGALLLKFEKRIASVPIESKELGFTKPGPYIYELLAELNITPESASMLIDIIEDGCMLLEEDTKIGGSEGSHKPTGTICRLESMGDILKLIFRDKNNEHAQHYRVHIQENEASGTDVFGGKMSRTLSWWCFNPGIALEEFSGLGVGSIILTSGTLSPMDSFAQELKLEFPISLENPHVISGNQIWAGVAPVGPSGYSFNSSYRNRNSVEYKLELGNAIVNFARIVPDGLLVFFPSYYLLEQCISCWKTTGPQNSTNSTTIWERICKHKLPVLEPRQSSLFPSAIDDYMKNLKDTSSFGSIFFAVCRGKVSEGLDFADHAGRAVVVTGLPFATLTDPKVRLKREYLDQKSQSQKTGNKGLTGEEWYSQQASRAVNQAVGRVIRHRHDYGAIIFCDERFTYSNRQSQVSSWIRPHIKCYSKFGDVVYTLTRFFRDSGMRAPATLEVLRGERQAENTTSQSFQLAEKFHLEKPRVSQMTATDSMCSLDSQSSIKQVKQIHISNHLRDIVPANRSHLKPDKVLLHSVLKGFTHLTKPQKESFMNGRKNLEHYGEPDGKIAPCLLKKPKLLINGPNQSKKHDYCIENSEKNKTVQIFEKVYTQSLQAKEVLAYNEKKDAGCQTDACCKEENKGSAFLSQKSSEWYHYAMGETCFDKICVTTQMIKLILKCYHGFHSELMQVKVRGKLNEAEYREFVGFMKALKSKDMKNSHGQVLQSIARLFSGPDRLPLLHGFKDFVPATSRSLYERFL